MIPKFERTALVILDGWGHGPNPEVSALAQAKTPFIDALYKDWPNSELVTYGTEVGLPEGQMGNSEVGHLNIGAGRVVYQELERINQAWKGGALYDIPVLKEALTYAKEAGKTVHLMGLVSDGGVHSHLNHLKGLCDVVQAAGVAHTAIHAFMDGRDTSPNGGVAYLKDLAAHIEGTNACLASVIGRYYAMDRDKRWERIKLAYDLMLKGEGTAVTDAVAALKACYAAGETDEFIKPMVCTDAAGEPLATVEEGDVVLCFNFRTDRCRQITDVLTQNAYPAFDMKPIDLKYLTMTRYDQSFEGIDVLFEKENLKVTLGEVLEKAGKTQVRIAETEKYPHVTFFFSGGREAPFEGEKRLIVPSPKVATYDLEPAMSAVGITETILEEVATNTPDFICLNYANADMVGHTGVFEAAISAAETVDSCTKQLVEGLLKKEYAVLIIADHGNSDFMINPDGSAHTAHTTNPVPCFLLGKGLEATDLKPGKLGDIAPTLLKLMDLTPSEEMDGHSLV